MLSWAIGLIRQVTGERNGHVTAKHHRVVLHAVCLDHHPTRSNIFAWSNVPHDLRSIYTKIVTILMSKTGVTKSVKIHVEQRKREELLMCHTNRDDHDIERPEEVLKGVRM